LEEEMNVENILRVADAIEQHSIPDLGFNMGVWTDEGLEDLSGHKCGTVACIGGWANAVEAGSKMLEWDSPLLGSQQAKAFLGLGGWESDELFFGCVYGVSPSQAVSVLRHLAKTGEVDWDRALAEPVK
jgi:hypothetical protein